MSRTSQSVPQVSWLLAAAVLTSSFALGACNDSKDNWPSHHTASISSALRVVPSCDALEDVHVDVLVNQIIANHRYDYGGGPYPDMGTPPPTSAPEGPRDFTDTNLQEQGVDEADIIRTDGDWMYVVDGSRLHIFKSWPAEETELSSSLTIRGANAELFLIKDPVIGARLVVISDLYNYGNSNGCDGWGCYDEMPMPPNTDPGDIMPPSDLTGTLLAIYDIQDPSDPQPVREVELEGNRITARVVDGHAYLVHTMSGYDRGVDTWEIGRRLKLDKRLPKNSKARAAALDSLRPELREAVRKVLNSAPTTLLPGYRVNAGDDLKPIFGCERFYAPDSTPDQWASLNILALNLLDDASSPNGVGVLANGGHAYASKNAIYIARDSRYWLWIDNQLDITYTDIHAFALENGFPDYAASGRVEGFTRDRFTMSEKDSIFRIATTDQNTSRWGGGIATNPGTPAADEKPAPQANNLFTLKLQGDKIVPVGEVRGFGVGEQIYGTRYVEDMAYVVTFHQTDPLYSIDLSDPANPTIRGELKTPGFSSFLQSIGDGFVVGIGQDADESGFVTGFQVQLFDVIDPNTPLRTAQLVLDTSDFNSSHSEAEHESRAFTWYDSHNLLSIPISTYDATGYFSGLLVMKIIPEDGANAIVEIGRVDHSALANPHCGYNCMATPDYSYWAPEMRRSAFIDDYLFAISGSGISVSHIDDLSTFLFSMPFTGN